MNPPVAGCLGGGWQGNATSGGNMAGASRGGENDGELYFPLLAAMMRIFFVNVNIY
jgi:hypothetical protein